MKAAGLIAIGMAIALSPSLSAQWPKYPTPGVPRTASGEPILDAPAPRTADGKPDLSGIWMRLARTGRRRCRQTDSSAAGHAADRHVLRCRRRIPRRPSVPAVGGGAEESTERREQQRQPRRALPADGPHAVPHAWAAEKDDPDAGTDHHPLRGQLRPSVHLTPTAGRCRPTASRSPSGMATRSGSGTAIRSSSKRTISETKDGLTCAAAR